MSCQSRCCHVGGDAGCVLPAAEISISATAGPQKNLVSCFTHGTFSRTSAMAVEPYHVGKSQYPPSPTDGHFGSDLTATAAASAAHFGTTLPLVSAAATFPSFFDTGSTRTRSFVQ